jgi:two-component system, NarL family, sensor histidine kinase DesK
VNVVAQAPPQGASAVAEPGRHGHGRRPGDLGDLAVAEALDVRQVDAEPEVLWQFPQRLPDVRARQPPCGPDAAARLRPWRWPPLQAGADEDALVTVLLMFAVENSGYVIYSGVGTLLTVLAVGDIALIMVLQLYHCCAARKGRRPRAWPVTLGLQVVLAYAFLFPFIWTYTGFLGPFVAGSILLLVPGRWRWAGFAAVVASYPVLNGLLKLHGIAIPASQQIPQTLFYAAITAEIGLMVYGLSRLAGLTRELEGLRDELARMAAVRERLRVARDVHDLLGLGLSAVALKADLIGALIGRDEERAAAEIEEMSRICAAVTVDVRLVTGDGQRLSLAAELAAAKQILASAGIEVRADILGAPLPAAADEVLAPVLREAVTNILRHAAATACVIEVTASAGTLRLHISNDGATPRATADGSGLGLANLDARVQAAGGQLTTWQAGDQFGLTAELPREAGRLDRPGPAGLPRSLRPGWRTASQPGTDDASAAGRGADGADAVPGPPVLEQVTGYAGVRDG